MTAEAETLVAERAIARALAGIARAMDERRWETAAAQSHTMARAAQPEEVANAVLWLASDASSYATGIGVPVAGGVMV
jgi:NAD(P)-dependent dehydrogenase (short-subunit alcohol dehydrogenase family)